MEKVYKEAVKYFEKRNMKKSYNIKRLRENLSRKLTNTHTNFYKFYVFK